MSIDIVTLLAISVAGLVWWSGRTTTDAGAAETAVGREWPLPARGEPLLVYVFRSDCPVCKSQLPNWNTMARSARSAGLRVRAFTPEEPTDPIRAYFGPTSTIPVDWIEPALLGGLAIQHVPATLVVDSQGVIRFHRVGVFAANAAELAETL